MWSGEPSKALASQSRQFSPSIRHLSFPTNLLRVEVNSSLLEYYTELDAVILRGVRERPMLALYKIPLIDMNDLSDGEDEAAMVIGSQRHPQAGDGKHSNNNTGNGYFDKLPYEVREEDHARTHMHTRAHTHIQINTTRVVDATDTSMSSHTNTHTHSSDLGNHTD